MRIKITMESHGQQIININYNYYISSLIYSFLKKSNEDYSYFLHNEGYKENRKSYKMFTFSRLIPEKYKVNGQNLIIEGKTALYITSPMKEFIMFFVDCLVSNPEIKIGNGEFYVINIEAIPEPKFISIMTFKCLSPVTMSTAYLEENSKLKKIDLYIEDKKFADNIKLNIMAKYKIIYGNEPENKDFKLEFFDIEKYKRGKLITYRNNIKIKGYLSPMKIKGNTKLIETAYECGIGDRNSLGMGMIEII